MDIVSVTAMFLILMESLDIKRPKPVSNYSFHLIPILTGSIHVACVICYMIQSGAISVDNMTKTKENYFKNVTPVENSDEIVGNWV